MGPCPEPDEFYFCPPDIAADCEPKEPPVEVVDIPFDAPGDEPLTFTAPRPEPRAPAPMLRPLVDVGEEDEHGRPLHDEEDDDRDQDDDDDEQRAMAAAEARKEAAWVIDALDHCPVGIDIDDHPAVVAYFNGLCAGDDGRRRIVPAEYRACRQAWLNGHDFATASAQVVAAAMLSRVGRRPPRRKALAAYTARPAPKPRTLHPIVYRSAARRPA